MKTSSFICKKKKKSSLCIGSLAVILSNYYDLPFNDINDWHKFSVLLKEHDVYWLKQILKDIAEFVSLHKNLVKIEYDFLSQLYNSK